MTLREMVDVLREVGWRRTLADLFGLVALVAALYAFTVVASAFTR